MNTKTNAVSEGENWNRAFSKKGQSGLHGRERRRRQKEDDQQNPRSIVAPSCGQSTPPAANLDRDRQVALRFRQIEEHRRRVSDRQCSHYVEGQRNVDDRKEPADGGTQNESEAECHAKQAHSTRPFVLRRDIGHVSLCRRDVGARDAVDESRAAKISHNACGSDDANPRVIEASAVP